MISSVLRLIRPHQWVKNTFVLLPLFFDGRIGDPHCWLQGIVAFFAFSLMASAIYCLNDVHDAPADRLHPKKCLRPVANGDISVRAALLIMAVLACGSLALSLSLLNTQGVYVAGILALYLVMNIAYCLKLKQYAIIDVFIVSVGFVLRIIAGGLACEIWLSPWIILMTFLLSLFMAFAKRRDDVILYEEKGIVARKNILRYNSEFLNQALTVIGTMTMMCYVMYSVSPEVIKRFDCPWLYTTSVFVLAGILRYLQVAIVDRRSGSPTKILLKDRFIQTVVVCWILMFAIIIYL